MHAFKHWLDRSLAAQAVITFSLAVGITALFRRDEHPVRWVVQGLIYTVIAVVFVAVQRRRLGRATGADPRGVAELNYKIRHREVPRAPEEQAMMRRLVAEQLGQVERGGRWLPYWLGSMGLVAVGMLCLGVVSGSWLLPLAFAVGVPAFCCGVLWMRRRSLERLRYMRSALRDQNERVS
jgi:hypothetical protein